MKQQPFDTIEVRENIKLTGNYDGKTGFYRQNSNGDLELMNIVAGSTRTITDNNSLTENDNGGKIEVNATSDITLTIPTSLPNNFTCQVFIYGSGNVTYIGASGITVLNPNELYKSNGIGSGNSIVGNSDSTKFIVGGDLKSA